MPEVSGKILTDAILVAPRGWYCVSGCYTYNSWRDQITYDVGIKALQPLSDGSSYSKVRKAEAAHPDPVGWYGTALSVQMLPLIAENYFVLSGRRLSVNDMSLPRGGLFDIYGNWSKPHGSHREGKDADINRDGVTCSEDYELRLAVDQLLKKLRRTDGTRTALLCELSNSDRKHIDFEG
jgi:hypothetical protein